MGPAVAVERADVRANAVTVREVRVLDLPRVYRLFGSTLANVDRRTRVFNLARQRGIVVLDVPDVGVMGFAVMTAKDKGATLWVDYFGVDPDAHGNGFGRLLMSQCESYGSSLGMKRIGLRARDPRALSFYERLGFELEPRSDASRPRLYKQLPPGSQRKQRSIACLERLHLSIPRECLQILTRNVIIGAGALLWQFASGDSASS
jgi:ribosomal protein S18 acetylase RimI-like enzyme